MTNLESRLLHFPPFLCYALCRVKLPPMHRNYEYNRAREQAKRKGRPHLHRHPYRRITRKEFSERSGINERTVERLVQRVNWRDNEFTVDQMLRFLDACGIDLLKCYPARKKLAGIAQCKKKFAHLTTGQLALFERRSREYVEYLKGLAT